MYAQFTDRARKVMEFTNEEALRLNHEYVGTEHILLGLMIEGSGVAANILKNLDIDLQKLRREIELIVHRGLHPITEAKLPLTPRAKKVLEYAIEEARALGQKSLGMEHLLLGLLREDEGVAAQILMNLGLRLEYVREEVLNLMGHREELKKAGGAVDEPEPPKGANAEIQHLPEPARKIVAEFDCQIGLIQQEKEEAVADQDWEKAANLRDLEDKLKKQRAKFIRRWPKNS
jgi:ATP-dependent Clp protease ATP-binding subunit ClpC